jgi:hypothetical protein
VPGVLRVVTVVLAIVAGPLTIEYCIAPSDGDVAFTEKTAPGIWGEIAPITRAGVLGVTEKAILAVAAA